MALVRLEDVKAQAGDDAKDAAWFTIDVSEKETEEGSFYAMELSNPERKLLLKPLVCLRETGELIRKEETVIRDRGHVASDHAAILLLPIGTETQMENTKTKRDKNQMKMNKFRLVTTTQAEDVVAVFLRTSESRAWRSRIRFRLHRKKRSRCLSTFCRRPHWMTAWRI